MASPFFASTLAALCAVTNLVAPAPAPRLVVPIAALAPAQGGYAAALETVDLANIAVNKDPETNMGQLETAIADLLAFGPQIAADADAREVLDLSQLNLARALLLAKDKAKAAKVMDAVLLTAHERTLPVKRFGPTLAKFHDKRRAELEAKGTASIQVECSTDCTIVIDEQIVSGDSGPLYLGTHRVWIEAKDGSAPSQRLDIELDSDGASEQINYPNDAPVAEGPSEAPPACGPSDDVPTSPLSVEPKRILPRWAGISVALIGVSAVVAGGVMLGLDGNCPGGLDPVSDAAECPTLYEGTVPGLVALGIGSALVVTGSVVIAVDEVRVGKQRGRQATVGWQMRF